VSLIFDKSRNGKNSFAISKIDIDIECEIPEDLILDKVNLPDVNETEVVRHYTAYSKLNFGVDDGMYPLGSCTMKYNPKINEKIATMDGFLSIHPLSNSLDSQGNLQVIYELSKSLEIITGMTKFSAVPAAGAHGELASIMVVKKYFETIGEKRTTILIADSAHGTNPASVAMCGFKVKEVPSTKDGDVDLSELKKLLNEDVAAMMLTSPNTLGLFDRNILKISKLLKENGSLFYGDGANLNAVMGRAKMSDMGFDIMHVNLHKTFSTPHGGGGPGSGPIGVVEKLVEFLPMPQVEKKDDKYFLIENIKNSIGKIHSFYGNFLVILKALIYIKTLGGKGIKEVSDIAVLNANYILSQLKDSYNLPINRICKHEFVLNDKDIPNGITTNEIAKRILDYGFHAPTVYFPLLISGAIMIEPTETESKETLDLFIKAMKAIRVECESSPEIVKNAPHNASVGIVDAVTAARKPIIRWKQNEA